MKRLKELHNVIFFAYNNKWLNAFISFNINVFYQWQKIVSSNNKTSSGDKF